MTPRDSPAEMWLTLGEAARAFDVSLSTLHRRRRSGDLESVGAFRGDDGSWRVPREGLAKLGFREVVSHQEPRKETSDTRDAVMEGVSVTRAGTGYDTSDTAELEELRERLAEAEQRAAVAEAISIERLRTIEAQSMALRMLEAGPAAKTAEEQPLMEESGAPEERPAPRRRRWWLFG